MSKGLTIAMGVVVTLLATPLARGHEGHAHKMMGTVAARHDNQLEVKAVDGKTATVTLNDKTRVLRGKAKVTAEDIKPGQRVVVTATEQKGADGKSMMLASEVRLAETDGPPSK
jgi:hypothetical protein